MTTHSNTPASPSPSKGLFISFEGIDGSGKSTQIHRLAQSLRDAGQDVVLTREPGGSVGAEEIRSLVLEGDPDRWSAESEILLFTAARRDHLEKTIAPAIEAGKIILCDRFADSTRMYQGISRGDLRGVVDQLHSLMIGREPDVTFIIDMDPKVGLARAKSRQTSEERFEDFGEDLQSKMRAGFLSLAKEFPERCILINGARDIEAVSAEILKIASHKISRNAGAA